MGEKEQSGNAIKERVKLKIYKTTARPGIVNECGTWSLRTNEGKNEMK